MQSYMRFFISIVRLATTELIIVIFASILSIIVITTCVLIILMFVNWVAWCNNIMWSQLFGIEFRLSNCHTCSCLSVSPSRYNDSLSILTSIEIFANFWTDSVINTVWNLVIEWKHRISGAHISFWLNEPACRMICLIFYPSLINNLIVLNDFRINLLHLWVLPFWEWLLLWNICINDGLRNYWVFMAWTSSQGNVPKLLFLNIVNISKSDGYFSFSRINRLSFTCASKLCSLKSLVCLSLFLRFIFNNNLPGPLFGLCCIFLNFGVTLQFHCWTNCASRLE